MRHLRTAACTLALMVLCLVPGHAAIIFNFPNFSSCAGLQINGNAACTGGVLRVTPATFSQSGSAFSTVPVSLGAGASFSTLFSFQITASGGSADSDGLGADGIVFVVQPVANNVGGGGGGIGYQGIPTSLGVEFDTWNNGLPGDPDGNHIGVDLNGSVTSVTTTPIAARINDGSVWYSWIDYDGSVLEVRLSQTNVRPATATMSYTVNLASVLGTTTAFVGFTSGTGAAFGNHDILTWQFDDVFAPIGVPVLPSLAFGLLALLLAAAGFSALRTLRT